ncbi:MAG: hypothetical protein IJF10_03070 [Clostridia bacterium]|nr:hypothetical protein [Clostridia bacterium]
MATEKADDFRKTRMRQNERRLCRPKRQITKKCPLAKVVETTRTTFNK